MVTQVSRVVWWGAVPSHRQFIIFSKTFFTSYSRLYVKKMSKVCQSWGDQIYRGFAYNQCANMRIHCHFKERNIRRQFEEFLQEHLIGVACWPLFAEVHGRAQDTLQQTTRKIADLTLHNRDRGICVMHPRSRRGQNDMESTHMQPITGAKSLH